MQNHTKYLYFHVLGEPLLHPFINEFIDMASQNYYVNITTNGYLISKIKNNKNIRQLNISLHSYTISSNLDIDTYLNNIMIVIETLKNRTYISLRLWQNNDNQEYIIKYLENYYQKKIVGKMKLDKNVFIEFDRSFIWPSLNDAYDSMQGTCRALKDHLAILVDGSVVPCCLDSEGQIKLGNIFNEEIKNIENSERYKNMLKGFNDNKKWEKLCQHCNFYQ